MKNRLFQASNPRQENSAAGKRRRRTLGKGRPKTSGRAGPAFPLDLCAIDRREWILPGIPGKDILAIPVLAMYNECKTLKSGRYTDEIWIWRGRGRHHD